MIRQRYTVLFFFDLKPHFFYLFVNFVDLLFNNFNMKPAQTENFLRPIDNTLCLLVNTLNTFLMGFGILAFCIFIYIETFRSRFHKGYLILRWVICYIRAVVYITQTIIFFYAVLTLKDGYLNYFFKLIVSLIILYIEINDIIWCYWLKDIIFCDDDTLHELYKNGIEVKYEKKAKEALENGKQENDA